MSSPNPIRIPQAIPCPESTSVGPAYVPCAPPNRRSVLLITILGSSLAFVDGSIVNVALPALQRSFQASASSVQWVVQSYALFCAALLLFSGALGDLFGRKKIFALGVMLFAVSSVGAALAGSIALLIVWRSLQGIGAAFLIPQSLAILSAAYAPDERAAAIGTWSAWTSVFAALGPVLGGWLIQLLSWRWAFAINVPVAAWIVLLMPRLRESETEFSVDRLQRLDLRGTVLNTAGLAGLVYALSSAAQFGWKDQIVEFTFVGGLTLSVIFLWTQAKSRNALMPLSLFSSPRFLTVNLLTFFLYGALGGAFYVVPFFAIQIKHLRPVATGAAFLPCIAVMFLLSSRVGQLSSRYGERWFLITGSSTSALGLGLFAIFARRTGYETSLLPGMLTLGLGLTIVLAPLTNVVMSSVSEQKTSIASAVNNAVSRLSSLVVLSALILVLSWRFDHGLRARLDGSRLPAQTIEDLYSKREMMTAIRVPADAPPEQQAVARDAVEQAYTSGYELVMYCCAGLALLSAIPVFIWWDTGHRPALETSQLI